MMIDDIKSVLAATPGVADWKITETRRQGSETFFVRDKVDSARGVDAIDYRLSVYADGSGTGGAAKTRGEASVSIHPTMTRGEIEKLVERTRFAASRSGNPWYPLPAASPILSHPAPSAFSGRGLESWVPELRDALYGAAAHAGKAARINSLELFLSRLETRIVNSQGIDTSFERYKGYVEYTVDAPSALGPVELTDSFSFSEPDFARLGREVAGRLVIVGDRAIAGKTPSGLNLPLILSGREAEAILGYFFQNLGAARIYSKASPYAIGSDIHGGPGAGDHDPITMTAEALLSGSPDSAPVDAEGIPLGRTRLCEAGRVTALVGPSRYAHYLGETAHGDYSLFSVEPGAMSASELRARPHLEVAFFSDFSVDADSGDFGAEIRLAYVSDGKTRRPVSGGSVTGSLADNRGSIRLSRETSLSGHMFGPEAILLPSVSITGGE